MDLFAAAERLMAMDDAAWRRHANPWSGLTRMATLPLLALAIWSRTWLGWGAVIPIVLVLAFIWLNPRLWPPPARLDAWVSRAVLGERIFLEHRESLPAHHLRAARLLTWATVPGAILFAWGLWALWWEAALFGTLLTMLSKLWFCDRMVWLREDWVRAGGKEPGEEG